MRANLGTGPARVSASVRIGAVDLRDSWSAWLAVSLTFVAASFAIALCALGLVSARGATGDVRDLLLACAGFNLVICTLVGLAVVSSSTSLVVASRRGAIARLLLVGATPGQVVRVLLTQLAIVALGASVIGDLVALTFQPVALRLVAADHGLSTPDAVVSPALLIGCSIYCAAVAVGGGAWQARRATAISPVESLRVAAGAPERRTRWWTHALRGVASVGCLGVAVASVVGFRHGYAELGERAGQSLMQLAAMSIALTGLGLAVLAPSITVLLTAVWTRLVPGTGAAWHLARHTAVSRSARLVRSVVPVMFTVGLCSGLLVLSESMVATLRANGQRGLDGASLVTDLSLLGLPLLIALAGSVGNLVMMSRQRDAELALVAVVGATPRQQVLVTVWEGTIVAATATLLGLLIAVAPALVLGSGLDLVFVRSAIRVPWTTLLGIVVVVWLVTVAATTAPSLAALRGPAPRVVSRLIAT